MGRDLEQFYKAIPLFKALTPAEVDEIVKVSRLFRAAAGTVVLEEGTEGLGMFVVVSGQVSARLRLFQGDEALLATLGKGDVFGELSLIDSGPVSATVTAVEDSILYFIERQQFDALRAALRPAAFKVLRAVAPTICDRLRAINNRVEEMFSNPERHLRMMEQRYRNLASDATVEDEGMAVVTVGEP